MATPWDYKIPSVLDDPTESETSSATTQPDTETKSATASGDLGGFAAVIEAIRSAIITLTNRFNNFLAEKAITYDNFRDALVTALSNYTGIIRMANGKTYLDGDGNAKFQNAEISGVLKTTVFEKDTVSAVGGILDVSNADVLDFDMSEMDTGTLTIKGETTFAVNDILELKDGVDDEYMRVTVITAAPRYTVTRDLGAAYGTNANPKWKAGTAVLVRGSSDGVSTFSGGFLRAIGSGTNSPKYSVYKRTGVAFDAITEYITIGNLNGLIDYVAEQFGIVIGNISLGYLAFDPTNGIRGTGRFITQDSFTTGHAIDQGDVVSGEGGLLYRARVNNWSANGTPVNYAFNPITANNTTKRGRFIDVSSTVKLALVASGNATNDITATRVVCSPLSATITSATLTVDVNTTANISGDMDGTLYTTNKVCVAYTNAAGGGIYAKVLSDLDTTVTLNTEATVAAVSNDRCAVVSVSSTEVLVIYTDVNDNIVSTSLAINASTNAITVGVTQTLLSDANVLQVRWAEQFGTTSTYGINFYDSTNTTTYVMAFTYAAAVYSSIGTPVSVVAALTRMSMASMSDTAMIMAGSQRSHGMTRSGTTLTVGSNTAIGAGNFHYVTRMGKGNAVVAWRQAAGDIRYQAVDMDTTSRAITLLGSAGTVDTTAGEDNTPMIVKLSPTRIVIWRDNTTNNEMAVATITLSTNFGTIIGFASAAAATATTLIVVQAGTSDDVTGLTTSTEYFADAGGGLTTTALGGSKHVGVTVDSTTEISVQLAG